MKSKGFTIIETVISLFIALIILTYSSSERTFDKNIYRDIESDGFIYEVYDFITYSRLKCRSENKSGSIIVSPSDNKIYYKIGGSTTMESIKAPDSISLSGKRITIPIREDGRLNKAETILFQDSFNRTRKITIRVGVDYISLDGK